MLSAYVIPSHELCPPLRRRTQEDTVDIRNVEDSWLDVPTNVEAVSRRLKRLSRSLLRRSRVAVRGCFCVYRQLCAPWAVRPETEGLGCLQPGQDVGPLRLWTIEVGIGPSTSLHPSRLHEAQTLRKVLRGTAKYHQTEPTSRNATEQIGQRSEVHAEGPFGPSPDQDTERALTRGRFRV
ncbi:hypothetical protein FKP32DRAFT_781341 [Trametes sanguinea]|nr:hypothetical protein FKP32DRAFT_781341 [Trametes sanguinea]